MAKILDSVSLSPDFDAQHDAGIEFARGVRAYAGGVSNRCLWTWIGNGKFPVPDGDLQGRRFWLRSTLRRWKQAALEGRYRGRRVPFKPAQQQDAL